MIEFSLYDTEDNPCYHKDGYHKTKQEFDDYGRLTRVQDLDINGIPMNNRYGYCSIRYEYNALSLI